VYVPERRYREVVDALAARASKAVVGSGMDPAAQLGPVNNRPQFDRVAELVADALAHGATAAAGGHPLDGPATRGTSTGPPCWRTPTTACASSTRSSSAQPCR
jgi:acyl-CoA reductase-like NAD-dependent aldehyde dehydrogenase